MSIFTSGSSGGGVKWSDYDFFSESKSITITTLNEYVTLFEVIGEGFIEDFTINTTNSNGTRTVRLIIDDVVVYESDLGGSGYTIGLINPKNIFYNTSNENFPYGFGHYGTTADPIYPSIKTFKTIDATSTHSTFITYPIFFKKNMKVEFVNDNTSIYSKFHILGGVK